VSRQTETPITRIGVCTAAPDVVLTVEGQDLAMPRGYGHFR